VGKFDRQQLVRACVETACVDVHTFLERLHLHADLHRLYLFFGLHFLLEETLAVLRPIPVTLWIVRIHI